MTREDERCVLAALAETGKPAVGSMGDDTPPAAMLDRLPRRLDDHFKLRFAQETSPPIDPIRDAWVFETAVALGDRSGLWRANGKAARETVASAPVFMLPERILSLGELRGSRGARARRASRRCCSTRSAGPQGLEAALDDVVARGLSLAGRAAVIVLSDRGVSSTARRRAGAARRRAGCTTRSSRPGMRHRVGIVADAGVWDIHHAALLVSMGADARLPLARLPERGRARGRRTSRACAAASSRRCR